MEKQIRLLMHAVKVIVEGKVQGVFYRASAQKAAKQYHLAGWVKNNADGSVELELHGDESKIEAMLRWCNKGPAGANVARMSVDEINYNEKLNDFEIRK